MKLRTLILIIALVLGIGSVAYAQTGIPQFNFLGGTDATSAFAEGSGANLDIGLNDWSWQIWFKTNQTKAGIMGKSASTSPAGRWSLHINESQLSALVQFTTSGTSTITVRAGTGDYLDNEWHQATVTLKRDGDLILYVDGVVVDSKSVSSHANVSLSSPGRFFLGAYGPVGGGTGSPISGWYFNNSSIAEARVWNKALTAQEVQDNYLYRIPANTPGLFAYWPINEGTGTTFHEITGSEAPDLVVQRAASNNYAWDIDAPITLPVELSYFNATVTSQYFVELHWMSQTETDMLGYIVLRSEDMKLEHAQQVSPLIHASNSSSQVSYTFTDEEVFEGEWYYWLQSIDLDGSHRFHGPTRAIVNTFQGGSAPSIEFGVGFSNIYPNPFNPSVTIEYKLADDSAGMLKVYNTRGQLVKTINLPAGSHSKVMEASDLPTGVYLFRLETGGKVYSHKAVLTK